MTIPITYMTGDATEPIGSGPRIIAHVCNDAGHWGAGFTRAISRKWSDPQRLYLKWYRIGPGFHLGNLILVSIRPDIWVANMIAQRGIVGPNNPTPIHYEALGCCLFTLAVEAGRLSASVHMPRIGCGLARGSWDLVEPIVASELAALGIPVFVYDLPGT